MSKTLTLSMQEGTGSKILVAAGAIGELAYGKVVLGACASGLH